MRFDHDLRAIIAYLASHTPFGEIRERFLRLQQISTLLNLDSVRFCSLSGDRTNAFHVKDEDVDEFYNESGISWKIGPHEARAIANLKL